MTYVLSALLLGAGLAIVIQGLKLLHVPLEGKRGVIRLIVAVAALGLAYVTLCGQAELAIEDILAYAAGIVAAAEGVYQWLIQQISKSKPETEE